MYFVLFEGLFFLVVVIAIILALIIAIILTIILAIILAIVIWIIEALVYWFGFEGSVVVLLPWLLRTIVWSLSILIVPLVELILFIKLSLNLHHKDTTCFFLLPRFFFLSCSIRSSKLTSAIL